MFLQKKQTKYIQGIDSVEYSKALIEPIRNIIDRGGKSWRSYAALACCDLVGGNSQQAIDWLALPELMHVGSLIVDDVEDKSDIRRGGPSCHIMYNEAVAINAGNACYFIGQIVVYRTKKITDKKRVKIYNLYFEALRAAHSGQALDIHGLDYMMDDVVKTGNGKLLEERLLAIHKLKSAAPASYLAQIGAVLGGGSKEQIKALGKYYEALGIAFQIVDDVLNLGGFENKLKTKAEDISAGKITFPIAKAMTYLDKKDRKRLWEIIKLKTQDISLLEETVGLINKVNANEKSKKQAEDIINKAWQKLDPKIKDSMVKLNLRAFSWYILDRHY
ncbi:MAG: polyprenyl synthetase family protein [Chitinophagales bacterium]|nr:polyprenyl synthetase family protein [Chitinophagales bacterium]